MFLGTEEPLAPSCQKTSSGRGKRAINKIHGNRKCPSFIGALLFLHKKENSPLPVRTHLLGESTERLTCVNSKQALPPAALRRLYRGAIVNRTKYC